DLHAPQVEGDEGAPAVRGETADDGGAAAERDEGQAVFGAGGHHREDVVVLGGQQDGRRDVGEVALADAQQVRGGLAAGVADPGLRVGAYVLLADGGGQGAVRGRVQGGGRDRQVLQREGFLGAGLDAEQIAQQSGHRVRQGRRPGRVAPAAPQHVHDCRPHRSVRAEKGSGAVADGRTWRYTVTHDAYSSQPFGQRRRPRRRARLRDG